MRIQAAPEWAHRWVVVPGGRVTFDAAAQATVTEADWTRLTVVGKLPVTRLADPTPGAAPAAEPDPAPEAPPAPAAAAPKRSHQRKTTLSD